MTPELLQSIQYPLLYSTIWGEVVLFAVLFNRYVFEKVKNGWIIAGLILVAIICVFSLSWVTFSVFIDYINPPRTLAFPETGSVAADVVVMPLYGMAQLGETIGNLIHLVMSTISATAIFVITLVVIRFLHWRKVTKS